MADFILQTLVANFGFLTQVTNSKKFFDVSDRFYILNSIGNFIFGYQWPIQELGHQRTILDFGPQWPLLDLDTSGRYCGFVSNNLEAATTKQQQQKQKNKTKTQNKITTQKHKTKAQNVTKVQNRNPDCCGCIFNFSDFVCQFVFSTLYVDLKWDTTFLLQQNLLAENASWDNRLVTWYHNCPLPVIF